MAKRYPNTTLATLHKDLYKEANLPSSGWQLVCLQMKKGYIEDGANYMWKVMDYWFEPIFLKHVEGAKEGEWVAVIDPNRLQFIGFFGRQVGKSRWAKHMRLKLEEQLNFILPGLVICWWALLWSKDGDAKQAAHQDFSLWDFPRFAGILSLEDGTKVCIGKEGHQEVLELRAGEVVIFRGDVFHSGAAYEKRNRRVYFKAIPRGCELYEAEKKDVGYGCICLKKDGGCGEKFPTPEVLYNHNRVCVAKKGAEAVREMKAAKCKRTADKRKRS